MPRTTGSAPLTTASGNSASSTETSGELVGFVRATSDLALNANLWNLCARPVRIRPQLLAVLVHRSLNMLRKDLPGCSLSCPLPRWRLRS